MIVPPGSEDKTDPTLSGVARLMGASPDPFTAEVGGLVESIAYIHNDPNACETCKELGGSCAYIDLAHSVAFAWLLKVVDERG